MFFINLLSFIQSDLVVTVCLCIIGSLCVALVMRLFKLAFWALDKLVEKKGFSEKALAIYSTIKAVLYFGIGFALTAFVLGRLMNFCVFPANNAKELAFLYFIPMLYLQYFFDKHLKAIFNKMFGIEDEDTSKEKKPKVLSKKVYYTVDEDGNEVPVEE